jgi:hypothetical protein
MKLRIFTSVTSETWLKNFQDNSPKVRFGSLRIDQCSCKARVALKTVCAVETKMTFAIDRTLTLHHAVSVSNAYITVRTHDPHTPFSTLLIRIVFSFFSDLPRDAERVRERRIR